MVFSELHGDFAILLKQRKKVLYFERNYHWIPTFPVFHQTRLTFAKNSECSIYLKPWGSSRGGWNIEGKNPRKLERKSRFGKVMAPRYVSSLRKHGLTVYRPVSLALFRFNEGGKKFALCFWTRRSYEGNLEPRPRWIKYFLAPRKFQNQDPRKLHPRRNRVNARLSRRDGKRDRYRTNLPRGRYFDPPRIFADFHRGSPGCNVDFSVPRIGKPDPARNIRSIDRREKRKQGKVVKPGKRRRAKVESFRLQVQQRASWCNRCMFTRVCGVSFRATLLHYRSSYCVELASPDRILNEKLPSRGSL